MLKPRGTLLLTTPHHGPRHAAAPRAAAARAFAEHFEPRSDHVRYFSPRTLRELLDDLGFDVADAALRRRPAAAALDDPRPRERARGSSSAPATATRLLKRRATASAYRAPMRVLLDTTYARRGPSGTGVYIERLTRGAARRRASRSSRPPTSAGRRPRAAARRSVRNLALDAALDAGRAAAARARRAAPTSSTTRCRRSRSRRRAPQVVTVHDLAFERLPGLLRPALPALRVARRTARAARGAQAVVARVRDDAPRRAARAGAWTPAKIVVALARPRPGAAARRGRARPSTSSTSATTSRARTSRCCSTRTPATARLPDGRRRRWRSCSPARGRAPSRTGVALRARAGPRRAAQRDAAALVHPSLHEGFGLTRARGDARRRAGDRRALARRSPRPAPTPRCYVDPHDAHDARRRSSPRVAPRRRRCAPTSRAAGARARRGLQLAGLGARPHRGLYARRYARRHG